MSPAILLKISSWFKSFGFVLCACLAFMGLLLMLISAINDNRAKGFEEGRTAQQAEASAATITQVEISHEAAKQIEAEASSGTGSLLYAQCMRSARTPANCKRFLPH